MNGLLRELLRSEKFYQQICLDLAALLFSLRTRLTHQLVRVFSSSIRTLAAGCVFISLFVAEIRPPAVYTST